MRPTRFSKIFAARSGSEEAKLTTGLKSRSNRTPPRSSFGAETLSRPKTTKNRLRALGRLTASRHGYAASGYLPFNPSYHLDRPRRKCRSIFLGDWVVATAALASLSNSRPIRNTVPLLARLRGSDHSLPLPPRNGDHCDQEPLVGLARSNRCLVLFPFAVLYPTTLSPACAIACRLFSGSRMSVRLKPA